MILRKGKRGVPTEQKAFTRRPFLQRFFWVLLAAFSNRKSGPSNLFLGCGRADEPQLEECLFSGSLFHWRSCSAFADSEPFLETALAWISLSSA